MADEPKLCDCEVCGRYKFCERVFDSLLKKHFWMCAMCVLGLSRAEGGL